VRWDTVLEFWLARLQADTALTSVLGASGLIYPAQAARPVRIPSVEYLMTFDREEENFNPIAVQVDFWAKGIKKAAQIERRIRTLTHRDVAQDLEGERLWMQFEDARSIEFPSDPGVQHRALDFVFTPVREQLLIS
jgi:hypothetical protein